MKYQLVILFLFAQILTVGNSFYQPSLAATPISDDLSQNKIVNFPEVGLAIPQPNGFEKATSFHGFQQTSSSSSILLIKIPGQFSEVQKVITKKRFAQSKLSLISRKPIIINNQNGLLLQVEQSILSQKVQKWIVVFGNQNNTYMITATFLKENALLGESLKKNILAATISAANPNISSLPFTIQAVDGLVLVQSLSGIGKVAGFTKNGQIPQTSPQDPLFIVTPSLGDVLVIDQKSFASRRLYQYSKTKIKLIESANEITIDNLSGWEIEAIGQDQETKTPLKLYQVMLFPKQGGYIVMTGVVGEKQADLYLPKFKAIAQTYKNSPQNSPK